MRHKVLSARLGQICFYATSSDVLLLGVFSYTRHSDT
jgi:hypothetical protein